MAMIGMSPWAAAAGGLAGGLGQGIMTGMDVAQRRRQEEAQKQRDAMQLLITGFKHLSDDPDALKQFTQWFGQTTRMPVPPWVGTGSDPNQRLMERYKGLIAAGATPEQANAATFGIKPTKPELPHFMMTPQGPVPVEPGKYHGIPQSMIPGWTFGPGGEKVPLEPGYKPPPEILKPEKETFAPEARAKRLTDLELIIKDPKAKQHEKDAALSEWRLLGGTDKPVPAVEAPWYKPWGGTPADVQLTRPDLKLKGQGGGGAPQGLPQLPDPKQNKGKRFTNPDTGEKVYSDGTKWIKVQ